MTKEVFEDIKTKAEELLAVPHCAPELKDAVNAWLNAVGTDSEKEAAKALIQELEEDVMPIDATISFFQSEFAVEKFGAETAKMLLGGAVEAKNAGAKYCNCAACKAGEALLNLKDAILG